MSENRKRIIETLSLNNPTVAAHHAMYSRGIISYEIMCEMLVIALSEQNDMYFKYAVEAESRAFPKRFVG